MRPAHHLGVLILGLTLAACGTDVSPAGESPAASSGEVLECVDVPLDICRDYGESAAEGPQPSGFGEVQRIVVTCTVRPPCSRDRSGSGGSVQLVDESGESWSQDWEVDSGI